MNPGYKDAAQTTGAGGIHTWLLDAAGGIHTWLLDAAQTYWGILSSKSIYRAFLIITRIISDNKWVFSFEMSSVSKLSICLFIY